jgi:hypothetical protein
MLRQLAERVERGVETLVELNPAELVGLLEQGWNVRASAVTSPSPPLGHPNRRSSSPGLPIPQIPEMVLNPPALQHRRESRTAPFSQALYGMTLCDQPGAVWDHLVYAYMIENTRIYEIFRRVLHEFLHGERLGVPTEAAQHWLRSTEELFYRDPPPLTIRAVTSDIRADLRASRRNAYQRMFGMDLNHGTEDNQPYGYVRPEAANKEFVTNFEELLREVWVGISNVGNRSGANPTDDAKIANLAETLHNMLLSRRQGGNLSREEFVFVSMMSWFHLTVAFESPIILALRAQAASPEERLFKIAAQVGLPAHGLSNSYFRLAEPVSGVLLLIEAGAMDTADAARAFYDPEVGAPNALPAAMSTIITHWSIITGRDMKARKVATT